MRLATLKKYHTKEFNNADIIMSYTVPSKKNERGAHYSPQKKEKKRQTG
jgi:hypothetical protein